MYDNTKFVLSSVTKYEFNFMPTRDNSTLKSYNFIVNFVTYYEDIFYYYLYLYIFLFFPPYFALLYWY